MLQAHRHPIQGDKNACLQDRPEGDEARALVAELEARLAAARAAVPPGR